MVSDHSFEPHVRRPCVDDASEMWRVVAESGVLDCNSPYLYLLLCRHFRETCLVAEHGNQIVGFVSGYRLPEAGNTLFVWQIGVSPSAQRRGVASRLLHHLVQQCRQSCLEFVEATVSPSNTASRRLFHSLARTLNVPLTETTGFEQKHFPVPSDANATPHEAEPLLRLGPLT
ncbi:MAG: diaminobutyrate acetyltransferase [Planctomycetaceae bacterium]|nr:diaminobutyrate acetyltransferase [Planctomycetaceae bacterium]